MKWELVDMGSLNGTLLNSQPINHPDTGSRNWGDPINLANGDIITLGTTSKVVVSIMAAFRLKLLPLFHCFDCHRCNAYTCMHDISHEEMVCGINGLNKVLSFSW